MQRRAPHLFRGGLLDEAQRGEGAARVAELVPHAGGIGAEAGTAALQMRRTYTTSDGEVAQVTINTHLSSRFRYAMTMRRVDGQAG